MDPNDVSLFGNIAVSKGFATRKQVDECLVLQRNMREKGVEKRLGEVMVRKGTLRPEAVDEILRLQQLLRSGALPPQERAASDDGLPPSVVRVIKAKDDFPHEERLRAIRQWRFFNSLLGISIVIAVVVIAAALVILVVAHRGPAAEEKGPRPPVTSDELAVKELDAARLFERQNAGVLDPVQIKDRYARVYYAYPGTKAGDEALAEAEKIGTWLRDAEERYQRCLISLRELMDRDRFEEADAVWRAFEERLSKFPASDYVRMAKHGRVEVKETLNARLSELLGTVELQLVGGGLEEALATWEKFEGLKRQLGSELPPTDLLLAEDRVKQGIEKAKLAVTQASQDAARPERRDRYLGEGRRAEAENDIAEALTNYRKALFLAEVESDMREWLGKIESLESVYEKYRVVFKMMISYVKNGLYDSALGECDAMRRSGVPMHEPFGKLLGEIEEFARGGGGGRAEALIEEWTREFDEGRNSFQAEIAIPSSNLCSSCGGRKVIPCASCGGSGVISEVCFECEGSGFISCHTCRGEKKRECPECRGRGTVRHPDGSLKPCARCLSSGRVVCETCRGTGKSSCRRCAGKGKIEWPCTKCSRGTPGLCPHCHGSALERE